MTTTSTRFFDELAKLATNAAGAAQGVRREVDTLVKAQVERILGDLDVVQREEFEAVRDMASKAREENEVLKAKIAALEARLGHSAHAVPTAHTGPSAHAGAGPASEATAATEAPAPAAATGDAPGTGA